MTGSIFLKKAVIIIAAVLLGFFALSGLAGCKPKKIKAEPTPVPTSTPVPHMEKIVYTYNGNLYWMDPDGASKLEIFADNNSKWFPSVSPDGWYIAYWVQTKKNYNLWVGDIKKRRAFQVTFDEDSVNGDTQNFNEKNGAAWTADSSAMVYSIRNDIWKMTRDGFDQTALTGTHDSVSPALSKENKLVFAMKEREDTYNLYMKDIDSIQAERLTKHIGKKAGSPYFSPDGRRVVYTVEDQESVNIYMIDIVTKVSDPLTYDGKSNCPSFSHDGTKIIFSSSLTDKYQPEIWIMNVDKSGKMKVTKDGGISPCWLYEVLEQALPTYTPTVPVTAGKKEEIFNIKETPQPGQEVPVVPTREIPEVPVAPDETPQPEVQAPFNPEEMSVRTVQQGDKLLFYPVIHYDSARVTIKPEFHKILDDMVKIIKAHNAPVIIEGHTDNIPIRSKHYRSNYELSVARANAVKQYLMTNHKIPASRISIQGFGETKPIVANDTEDNRYRNRRAEVMIIKIADTEPAQPVKVTGSAVKTPVPVKKAAISVSVPTAVPTAAPAGSPTVAATTAPVKVQTKSKKTTSW